MPDGKHRYSYSTGNSFFDSYGRGEIRGGEADVEVVLHKSDSRYLLDISINGRVELLCDRCLEPLMYPVWVEQRMELEPSTGADAGENSIAVDGEAEEVDLGPSIYELIDLSLPMRRVHAQEGEGNSVCDVEMIKLIEGHNEENNNNDNNTNDPRWDELKKLIT